jgi:uncharacterized membrane-anchored protein YjiN (DUF445 family)
MTLDFLPRILPWVLPPLVGAVIGYITNAVAIRMLFRPLAAKRLFGLRLPLTPGIIPRQRYELAESIGRMVSRELITEEAIQHQLGSASFRRGLRRNVGDLIEEITLKPLASFAGKDRELLLNSLESFLAASLSRFFSSQAFIQTVRELVTRLVGSAAARKPAELLGEQGRQFLHRTLENLLSRLGQPDRRPGSWAISSLKSSCRSHPAWRPPFCPCFSSLCSPGCAGRTPAVRWSSGASASCGMSWTS